MANHSKHQKSSPETEAEALKIAKGIQKPGQTKEQTRLIAQGIQKGIDLYKKQQKAKAREADKARKKRNQQAQAEATDEAEVTTNEVQVRHHWLPWGLLVFSWLGFAGYLLGLAG